MSIYGDLSKAQRAFLHGLFQPGFFRPAETAVPKDRPQTAVSIDTAVFQPVRPQLRRSMMAKGLVQISYVDGWRWACYLTPAGLELMRSLDYRHARSRV